MGALAKSLCFSSSRTVSSAAGASSVSRTVSRSDRKPSSFSMSETLAVLGATVGACHSSLSLSFTDERDFESAILDSKPLSVLFTRIVFRYWYGFYLFPVLARVLPFSGTHTDCSVFMYSAGQFFGTRTDSTFSRYSPRFYRFQVLTLILPFFGTCRHSFSVLARILRFPDTLPDSTGFRS